MKQFSLVSGVIVLSLLLIAAVPVSHLTQVELSAQTFIVNSIMDGGDTNWGDSICETSTPSECTLRAAIEESNANPGTDTINFSIPGAGPYTISPSYGFDFIFDSVIIDGTTQPGFAGTPIIELDGSNAGVDAYGIVIFAGSSTVRGLVINRFNLAGIDLDVNGANIIQGNYIGTDITGSLDLGNGTHGIAISQAATGNIIGGTTSETRNVISGNGQFGITIVDTGSTGNLIVGNYIGTDATGTLDLGNSSAGIAIAVGASDNVVGGTELGAGNLISGNESAGIIIVDVGTTGNLVQGNYIGTDTTGTLALGNVYEGVFIGGGTSGNVIGGNVAGAGNLISGNNGNGVTIADTGTSANMVQGNYVGTDVTGNLSLGNTGHGILLVSEATNNSVGATTSGAGNIIAFNSASGIVLSSDTGSGNTISSNSIFSNGFLGIDLGDDGVTFNDLFDWDNGPNNLQNFAVITAVKTNGATTNINFKLTSTPNTTFRVELFSSATCNPSGYGDGNAFLGYVDATTNAGGQANMKVTLATSLPVGSLITATITDPNGNTSEFSQCETVNQSH